MATVAFTAASGRGVCTQGGVCARNSAFAFSVASASASAFRTSSPLSSCSPPFAPAAFTLAPLHHRSVATDIVKATTTTNTTNTPVASALSQARGYGQQIQGRRGQGLLSSSSLLPPFSFSLSFSPSSLSSAAFVPFRLPDQKRRHFSDIKMSGLQHTRSFSPPFLYSYFSSTASKHPLRFSSSSIRCFSQSSSSSQPFDITLATTTTTTTTTSATISESTSSTSIGRSFSSNPLYSLPRPSLPLISSSSSSSSPFFTMYRRYALGLPASRRMATMTDSNTPIEDTIREKVTTAFKPSFLEIHNDSHLHAHHKPMIGSTSRETHFRIHVTSDIFKSKMPAARHRMVYALLSEEMAREGGIHALSLLTMTPEEEARRKAKAEEKRTGGAVPCNSTVTASE